MSNNNTMLLGLGALALLLMGKNKGPKPGPGKEQPAGGKNAPQSSPAAARKPSESKTPEPPPPPKPKRAPKPLDHMSTEDLEKAKKKLEAHIEAAGDELALSLQKGATPESDAKEKRLRKEIAEDEAHLRDLDAIIAARQPGAARQPVPAAAKKWVIDPNAPNTPEKQWDRAQAVKKKADAQAAAKAQVEAKKAAVQAATKAQADAKARAVATAKSEKAEKAEKISEAAYEKAMKKLEDQAEAMEAVIEGNTHDLDNSGTTGMSDADIDTLQKEKEANEKTLDEVRNKIVILQNTQAD